MILMCMCSVILHRDVGPTSAPINVASCEHIMETQVNDGMGRCSTRRPDIENQPIVYEVE